ncbi:hypothetical protein C7445_101391 [Alicyclobacillus sacchari]|uniref:Uncharacterized protein n=1 Tax=Alicyclobacillus sacchari TaxID=392010 RepID=A0A4R8LUE9_9BACL|nr:hypothetical protein [Alicyclobacillus sacchari]TDY51389.1 hypothetical protein C7445_101391 [Alicyclobacillus sacchari]
MTHMMASHCIHELTAACCSFTICAAASAGDSTHRPRRPQHAYLCKRVEGLIWQPSAGSEHPGCEIGLDFSYE